MSGQPDPEGHAQVLSQKSKKPCHFERTAGAVSWGEEKPCTPCIAGCISYKVFSLPQSRHNPLKRVVLFRAAAQGRRLLYRNDIFIYSVRRLFTGLANAALIAWKLIVARAMMMAVRPPAAKSHQGMVMR